MKKILALVLVLMLTLGLSIGAQAAPGDVTVWYGSNNDGYQMGYLQTALLAGNRIWCVIQGSKNELMVYDRDSGEQKTYNMEETLARLDAEREGADSEGGWTEVSVWFAWQDRVCAIVSFYSSNEEEGQSAVGGAVYELTLEGNSAILKESSIPALDWECMLEQNDGWVNSRYIRSSFCMGDQLWTLSYDDSGNDVINSFDLTDGHSEEHFLQNLNSMAAGPDGKLLVTQYNWEGEEGSTIFSLFDPSSESMEVLANRPMTGASPQNLYYHAGNNNLYFTESGELWAAENLDLEHVTSVNDCPLAWEGGAVQMTEDGYLLLHDSQTAVLRSTDPSLRKEVSLHVNDFNYVNALDSAYYAFTAKTGDVSVVIDRNGTQGSILNAMMNHDDTVDIYCLDMASSQFSVLYQRGYMASMNGSEKLNAVVDSFYPSLASAVRTDGQLVALPIYASGDALGISMKTFAKLGYTEADLPTTWDGFFDLLAELPAKMESVGGVIPFNTWFTAQDIRVNLFNSILTCYQNYLNAREDRSSYAFNTPITQHLLERLEAVDYAALGIRERSEGEEEDGIVYNWEDAVLFEFNTPLTMGNYNSEFSPMLMAVADEGVSGSYHVTAAFINPYSSHVNEAVAYLESVWDCVDKASAYTFSPENNEPIRYPDYEQMRSDVESNLQQARTALAEAVEEEEKRNWQETVNSLEENLKEMETGYWSISPQAIASYQARAPYLKPMFYDFTSMMTESGDYSFYDVLMRFYQGECTSLELLEQLDEKYQMMIREGN